MASPLENYSDIERMISVSPDVESALASAAVEASLISDFDTDPDFESNISGYESEGKK